MKFKLLLSAVCFGGMIAHAQLNVQFISNLDYEPILNDIWGYVDEDSTEYALVGLTTGLSIVSLADPTDPKEVQFIPGVNSTWRDMKTYGHFAYLVADQGADGLLMVDLSPLPADTAVYAFWKPEIAGLGVLRKSHNIWIDEYGLAYLAGSNIGGTIILDIHTDPWIPVFLAKMPFNYAHDIYARDSIVYASEIYEGQLRVYDISDISNIQLLGSVTTPHEFTHNAWLSDDGNTIFTTDERGNAFIGSYDVSDPSDIKELDRFRPTKTVGLNVIPHNVHVWDDYVIISYYTDGCIIVDASQPDNLIEVGNFDTYLEGHGGYGGAWGAYPYLPSGNILVSDRQNGLFVLGPNYVRGCYLEGSVRDAETQLPIVNAEIQILLDSLDDSEVLLPESSDLQGEFRMGKAVPGTFMVKFSHPDYIEQIVEGTFENGLVLELNIELMRIPRYMVTGRVVDITSSAVPFAYVAVQGNEHTYQTQADDQGQYLFPSIIEGSYQIYAGNWGMYEIYQQNIFAELNEDIVIHMGYYDDFLNDLGWSVSGISVGAQWERAVPVSELLFESFQCNPAEDLSDDFGGHAFVTGNMGGDAANDDVGMGYTLLSSPVMDLADFNAPVLSFTPWICERFVEEQVYFVLLSNGTDTVTIDTITTNDLEGFWQTPVEMEIGEMIDITDQMHVHFLAQDTTGTNNVVKAAVDRFVVYDALPSATRNILAIPGEIEIYPNPAGRVIHIDYISDGDQPDAVIVFDIFGKIVFQGTVTTSRIAVDLATALNPGIYLVQVLKQGMVLAVGKVVVE